VVAFEVAVLRLLEVCGCPRLVLLGMLVVVGVGWDASSSTGLLLQSVVSRRSRDSSSKRQ